MKKIKQKLQEYNRIFKSLTKKQIFSLLFWPALFSYFIFFLISTLLAFFHFYEEIYYLPSVLTIGIIGGLVCFYITERILKDRILSFIAFIFWGYMSSIGYFWVALYLVCTLTNDCV